MAREFVPPNPGSPALCLFRKWCEHVAVHSPPSCLGLETLFPGCLWGEAPYVFELPVFLLGPFPLQRPWWEEASRRTGGRRGSRPSWELTESLPASQIPGLPPLCPWLPARTPQQVDTPGCSCFNPGRLSHSRSPGGG